MKIEKDMVSVVFPTMNQKEDLLKCIKSIMDSTHKKVEVVISDNGSTDGSIEAVKKAFPKTVILQNELNMGSPMAINNCIKASRGEFIFRLDDDEFIEKDTIEKMLKVLKSDEKIAITGCLYFYTEKPTLIRTSGLTLNLFTGKTTVHDNSWDYDGRYENHLLERDAVGGGCILCRRTLYDEMGLYAEKYFLTYEDMDFCYKVTKKGYKIVVVGSAKLYHKEAGGISQKESPFRVYLSNRGKVLFMKDNAGWRNLIFYPYLILLVTPIKIIKYSIKKDFANVKALLKGIYEGLFTNEVFVFDKDRKKILKKDLDKYKVNVRA